MNATKSLPLKGKLSVIMKPMFDSKGNLLEQPKKKPEKRENSSDRLSYCSLPSHMTFNNPLLD